MSENTFELMSKCDSIYIDSMVDGTWEVEVLMDCLPYFGKGKDVETAVSNACIAALHQTPVCPETAIEGDCTQEEDTDTLNDRGSNQYANPEQCRHLGVKRVDRGMTFCDECGVELL